MSETTETKKRNTPKKSTPKKPSSKSNAKTKEVEVAETTQTAAPQMEFTPEMMAMFQQFLEMQQGQTQQATKKETKRTKSNKGVTKQAVRRKYKGAEIYLTSVIPGSICYKGKNDTYEWNFLGDTQPVLIEDLMGMPEKYLFKPLLEISEIDNDDEEMLQDLVSCLKLESVYGHLTILDELENDIENIDMEKLEEVLRISRERGHDITASLSGIVQTKIDKKELKNYHAIAEFERVLGRSFNK